MIQRQMLFFLNLCIILQAGGLIESFVSDGFDAFLITDSAPFYARVGVISMSNTAEVGEETTIKHSICRLSIFRNSDFWNNLSLASVILEVN